MLESQVFITKYNIIKPDYLLEISLAKETIKITNIKKHISIYLYIIHTWEQSQFMVSDSVFDKLTVLNSCVMEKSYHMCTHLISAFQHIIPNITDDDMLYLFNALLSLKDYPILARKFKKIWENNIILCQYKIFKYKKQQLILLKNDKTDVLIPIYENKIKNLQEIIQNEKKSQINFYRKKSILNF